MSEIGGSKLNSCIILTPLTSLDASMITYYYNSFLGKIQNLKNYYRFAAAKCSLQIRVSHVARSTVII
jgi:hypothetical protein